MARHATRRSSTRSGTAPRALPSTATAPRSSGLVTWLTQYSAQLPARTDHRRCDMSSDADLTTGDLARPGGGDRPEVSGTEGRGSDRRAGAEASVDDQAAASTRQTGTERAQGQDA